MPLQSAPTDERIHRLMTELRAGLEELYGSCLKGLYLYGSYATGAADKGSDVDVLIVLDHIARYSAEINRTSHLISSLSLRYTISMSRVFLTENDWENLDTPFLANVREEAVSA